MLALSDGVFAIIITLLVLEIHVPELTQGHSLNEALAEVRPSFYAFVITFILAGMCLLPFGAGLVGRYDQEPVALRIYGLLLVAIAVADRRFPRSPSSVRGEGMRS